MELLNDKRCHMGKSPVWNEKDGRLWYVNGFEREIICADIETGGYEAFPMTGVVSALGFAGDFRMILTRRDGVYYLSENRELTPLYDMKRYSILCGSDSKAGPDGRYYVGTQGGKRFGTSDKADGRLYSIDRDGNVKVVLDSLMISGGFDWSMDEKYLYHADSGTGVIKEYEFDKAEGTAVFTGRQIELRGADGFTIDCEDCLLVSTNYGKILRINTADFTCVDEIDVPAKCITGCAFAGHDMKTLVAVTSRYKINLDEQPNAGLTYIRKNATGGRLPYLFG